MTAIDLFAPAYRSAVEMAAALAEALEDDPSSADYAARQLCDSVDLLDSPTSLGGRRGFESSGAALNTPTTPDLEMALAAADAQIAMLMLTASRAVGEQGDRVSPDVLGDAAASAALDLERLDGRAASFNFNPDAGRVSADGPAAAARFRENSLTTFKVVVDECEQTIQATAAFIRDHSDKVVEALTSVGDLLEAAGPRVALLRRAWDRLKACVSRLYAMVQKVTPGTLNDWLMPILRHLSLRDGVEKVLAMAAAREEIAAFTFAAPLAAAQVDLAADEVAALATRFRQIAASARIVVSGLTLFGGMIAAYLTGPAALLAVPGAYIAVACGTLVIARDFTDRGDVGVVRGVLQIGHDLAAGAAASGR